MFNLLLAMIFLMISGVGEKKLEEYFEPFSKTITAFIEENNQ